MTEKLKLTPDGAVVDSEWKDDTAGSKMGYKYSGIDGIEYEEFANEAEYIAPEKVEKTTAEKVKARNIKIGRVALFSRNEKMVA